LHLRGLSYAEIGVFLTEKKIPTPLGRSTWKKRNVDRLLHTRWVQEIIEELGTW
jgi:hypothetical protein